MIWSRESNPRPPALQSSVLPTELGLLQYLCIFFYLFFSGNRKPVQDVWFVDEPVVVQYYSSGSIVSFLRSHV